VRLILKRLSLGLSLIALCSGVLLISDLKSRKGGNQRSPGEPKQQVFRVALLQQASQSVLDQGVIGVIEGLREKGFIDGQNISIRRFNAEGDMPTANAIAKDATDGKYDLVLTVSTPSMQAVANANKAGKARHVFGLVSDPYGAGVGINPTNHLDHPPHMAGYGTLQPVAACFRLAREMYPKLRIVGVVWNPSESNSEAQLKLARAVCGELGIQLLESNAENSSAVLEAANAVVGRGAEAIWVPGDVTVLTGFDSVKQAANRGNIPLFTVIPPHAERGALFDLGANYTEVGKLTGQLAGEILAGRDPATVPIDNVIPEVLVVNKLALAGLKDPWRIPDSILQRATVAIDETGKHEKKAAAEGKPPRLNTAGIPRPPAGKTYRISLAYFAPEQATDSCINGLLSGLKQLGFEEGSNLTVSKTHAQGEMLNIPSMLQNLDQGDSDLLVTFTTPVLQGACFGIKKKPVVFTCVTDPIAAGAGKSWTDHYAHVTGVGSFPPLDETMELIPQLLPGLKSLGTLYNSGEANSMKIISVLRELTKKKGIELVELTAANSGEVLQAAQGLVARRVQAIYIPSDNTAYQAFDAIMKVADTARLPVINDDAEYLEKGLLASCGPGFFDSGLMTSPFVARVLLGENPANIPMTNVSINVTQLNFEAAKKLGITIPAKLIQQLNAKTAAAAPAAKTNWRPQPRKTWRVQMINYNESPAAEEVIRGLEDGWKLAGLIPERNFTCKQRSAQGDMATLNSVFDAALSEGCDMFVVLSTPTLQTAVKKVKDVPVVFAFVANPMIAGAGKSYTDHLPNITGVSSLGAFAEMAALLQKHFPQYKRVGTLFCPAEINSVHNKDAFVREAALRGITVETVPVNTSSDLPEAASALCARRIDAITQIVDNLTASGFVAVGRAAQRARLPLFTFDSSTIKHGAAVAVSRDFHSGGAQAAEVSVRVMRGESPSSIPFSLINKTRVIVHLANAQELGMSVPASLIATADEVIRN